MRRCKQGVGRRLGAALMIGAAVLGGSAQPAEAQPKGAQVQKVEEAKRLNAEAIKLYEAGKYNAALPLAERALASAEKAHGPDNPGVAILLNNLASVYRAKGDYSRAEPLYKRALATLEKARGPDHPDVAQSLDNLARLYHDKGNYAGAEPLYKRALAILMKARGPDHPDVAQSLNNLARLYHDKGYYDRAEPLFQRALATLEKARGPDHPDVAASLNNLARLYKDKGDYSQAEPLYQRALAIVEKARGPDHFNVAQSLNNLASLYRAKGDYSHAERLFQRALALWEKALGPDHPDVAKSLNNLASLYKAKGDYSHAVPLYLRALSIREKALPPDHPDVAQSLNNLAGMYQDAGDYVCAETLYQRALAIWEKSLRPDHSEVAKAYNNLACLYHDDDGNYTRAEPLFQRALAIREKALGPDHPDVAQSLSNLARLYQDKDSFADAERLFQRALAIREKALGPDHPDVASSLDDLATFNEAKEDDPHALVFAQRAAEIREKHITLLFATDAESQKRDYLETIAGELDRNLWLAIRTGDRKAAALAFTTLLRRKGRTLDATAGSMLLLRSRLGVAEQKLFDQLLDVRSQRSMLMVRGPGPTPLAAYRKLLADLKEQDQTLQHTINERSLAFRAEEQPITVAAVQAALAQGSALVEWSVYQPFRPKATTRNKRWGPARYAACVLAQQGQPRCIDLGEAALIDAAVTRLRKALSRAAGQDVQKLARDLDALVMAPVRKLLSDTRWVFLSPDGALNLVPFAALVDEKNRYLVESYAFTYLTSGRDLLRLQDHSARPREDATVIAFPDFDARGPAAPTGDKKPDAERGAPSLDLSTMTFSALPGTAIEARRVTGTMGAARVLAGAEATEKAFKSLHGPRLLHVATHGFFLPDQPELRAPPRMGSDLASPAPAPVLPEDPLVRSGLAFAGANLRHSGSDDGLLTAMEVSGTDLYGTSLVVLSACKTGVGDVVNADGVYGLRRALVLAGARTQVMSLWKVEDVPTEELMTAYYQRLGHGEGKSEAMRKVQLAMLAQSDREHPYYWASFIVSGDWTSLDGKAVVPDVGRVSPGPRGCACALDGAPEGGSPAAVAAALALGLALARQRRRRRVPSRWLR